MGKILIIIGIILVISGLWIHYGDRNVMPGKLPGDFSFEKGNVKIYFPIVTCIVISIVVSVILYLIQRFKN